MMEVIVQWQWQKGNEFCTSWACNDGGSRRGIYVRHWATKNAV